MADQQDRIVLEHGSGGALSRELVEQIIYPFLRSDKYLELDDASAFTLSGTGAFTTDTFVVDPLFFPGGDIGTLAVFGTCNDLAVSGAEPQILSMGLVLEEGLLLDDLRNILKSVQAAAKEAGVHIVTGDTKVVPRGKGGGVYINTAGIGSQRYDGDLGVHQVRPGDAVIISAPPGAHGITILAVRERLKTGSSLSSDCANLYPLCESLFGLGDDLRFMRDATRGGVSAVLNEAASSLTNAEVTRESAEAESKATPAQAGMGMLIREKSIPMDPMVASIAKVLGLNPLEVANEGVFVAIVSAKAAPHALELLSRFAIGADAAVIGEITSDYPGRVVLETPIGGRRILDFPRGLLLPRIC